MKDDNRQRSIAELQSELKQLKDRQHIFLKLNLKAKQLQEKQRLMKIGSESKGDQNQEIQRLKQELETILTNTKRVDEDNKIVKQQIKSLINQLKLIDVALNTVSEENRVKRQRIQLKDQLLVQKEGRVRQLIEKRSEEELTIESLRKQIFNLQTEQERLRQQIKQLQVKRQHEERQKQKLRQIVMQLRKEIDCQQSARQDYKIKIQKMKQSNDVIKEQLVNMMRLEDQLKRELEKAVQNYHNSVSTQNSIRGKIQIVEDEILIAQGDVKALTQEYIRQGEYLRMQEIQNSELNRQFDALAKQGIEVWQSVRELLEIQNYTNNQIRSKAYCIWVDIQRLISKD